jgi:hypothetical protein
MADFFEWNALERRTVTDLAFVRAIEKTIPPDTIEILEFLANHPRTVLLRRLAVALTVDILGNSILEAPTASAPLRSLPMTVTEATRANVLAAVFEVSQGNIELALTRLGENVAIGEHLLRTPTFTANRLALSILRNQALYPLASLERARGNADRAAQLDRAAEQVRLSQQVGNAAALAADPGDFDRFSAAVTDPHVPIGYRVLWLRQGWAGLCAHPREIILGPSSFRQEAMVAVANSMSDNPLVGQEARLFEALWRWPVTAALGAERDSPTEVRLEDRMLMGTIFRVLSCATPGAAH